MSQLVHILYPLPDHRRTPLSLLRWWESRRLFYNLVVGGTGLLTLVGIGVFGALLPGGQGMTSGPPWELVIVYGVMANLCYSLGWSVEMLASLVWGREAPDLGPLLFREGLIFSVGVTLLPLGLASLMWMFGVVAMLVT